jgi:hypothetical protein
VDWTRVVFTEHMVEAAAVEGACDVVFDFGAGERASYRLQVFRVLKGSGAPYFATGEDRERPDGFRPFGEGETPEAALQACLESAGIHHRRHERQRPE